METYAFVDTNVLLHYRFFRDVDWAAALGVRPVTLVFAPVVLAELDQLKWAGSRREKSRAKAVLAALDDLGLAATSVALRPGVNVAAASLEPDEALFGRHQLHPAVNDDRLLASLFGWAHGRDDCRVLLLTADAGIRVKARALQIEAIAPDESLALGDEPDETERQLAAAQHELAALRGAAPVLRVTIDGATHTERIIRFVRPYDAPTVARMLDGWRSANPQVEPSARSVRLPDGRTFSLESLSGLPGFISEADAATHNKAVDRLLSAYESFLREWPAVVNRLRRTLALDFVLENFGTAPADDVDVVFSTTTANGLWLRALPDAPRPPAMPRRRDWLERGLSGLMTPRFDPRELVHPAANVTGPDVDEGDQRSARYTVKRVKHHVPCALDVVYFEFASDEDVRSFAITCRLIAANIRAPQEVTLHVKVETEHGETPPPLPPPSEVDA